MDYWHSFNICECSVNRSTGDFRDAVYIETVLSQLLQSEHRLHCIDEKGYVIVYYFLSLHDLKESAAQLRKHHAELWSIFLLQGSKNRTFRPFKQYSSHLPFCVNVYLCCRCVARVSQRSWSVWAYWMLWIRTRTSPTSWPSSSESPASNWPKASKHTSPR